MVMLDKISGMDRLNLAEAMSVAAHTEREKIKGTNLSKDNQGRHTNLEVLVADHGLHAACRKMRMLAIPVLRWLGQRVYGLNNRELFISIGMV